MAANILVHAVLLFFPALMALSAFSDLLTMTIPNRLCLALAAGYVAFAIAVGVPAGVLAFNFSCGAGVLILTFGLFSRGWIGGGDAKLAAATALWLGWGLMLDYGLYASLFGGALTLAIILFRKAVLPNWLARFEWILRLQNPKGGVPYGIALAGAGLLLFPQTQIWRAAAGL